MLFSIYGKHLGPVEPCHRDAGFYSAVGPNSAEAYARALQTLPRVLCGVVVLIEEEAVPLLYVQEGQINFLAPNSIPSGRRAALRVMHNGLSSVPVLVKSGPDQMSISQQEAAYTGMPVWVRLHNVSDGNRPVELPFGIPWIWALPQCPRIEVMYNRSLLPELKAKTQARQFSYSGPPCPSPPLPDRQSLTGRIPLHLRYRFDRPGIYLVRYVPGTGYFERRPLVAESQWMPIRVGAGSEEQRRKWLKAKLATSSSDRETLVYDVLPSVFGYGDAATLSIALKYLYHPDAAVSGATGAYLRDYYAASALVPALEQIVKRKGANRNVDQLLRDLRPNSPPQP